jgi:hypothetical protein
VEAFCKANEINYHRVATDVALEDLFLRRLKGSLLL